MTVMVRASGESFGEWFDSMAPVFNFAIPPCFLAVYALVSSTTVPVAVWVFAELLRAAGFTLLIAVVLAGES